MSLNRDGRIAIIVMKIVFGVLLLMSYLTSPEENRNNSFLIIALILFVCGFIVWWLWVRRSDEASTDLYAPRSASSATTGVANLDVETEDAATVATEEIVEDATADLEDAVSAGISDEVPADSSSDEVVSEIAEADDVSEVVTEEIEEVVSDVVETSEVAEEVIADSQEAVDDVASTIDDEVSEVAESVSETIDAATDELAAPVDDAIEEAQAIVEASDKEGTSAATSVSESEATESAPVEVTPPVTSGGSGGLQMAGGDDKRSAEELATAAKTESGDDDLTIVEGIGPKYSAALRASGIDTFAKVGGSSLDDLRAAAKAAGMRNSGSMVTWAEQATLAAEGRWEELETLQQTLNKGRRT